MEPPDGRFRGSLLWRHSLSNFAGLVVPLAAAFVALPLLLRGMGVERYGVFVLLWSFAGALILLDFGLSRAATYFVARHSEAGDEAAATESVFAVTILLAAVGVVAGAATWACADTLTALLQSPEALREETRRAVVVVGAGLPGLLMAALFRGVLEAHHRFGDANVIRVVTETGLLAAIAALSVLGAGLDVVLAAVVLFRFGAALWYFRSCRRAMPGLAARPRLGMARARAVAAYGGWLGLSDAATFCLLYLDRFVVAALLGVSAVAYYGVAQEIVSRLWLIPMSVVTTLFPMFSRLASKDAGDAATLFARAVKTTMMIMGATVLALIYCTNDLLRLWLGEDVAREGSLVLQIFLLGLAAGSIAPIATSLVRGSGQPAVVSLLLLCEVIVYIPLLYFVVGEHGMVGAAIAWSGRWIVHGVILVWVAVRRGLLTASGLLSQGVLTQWAACFAWGAVSIVLAAALAGSGAHLYGAMLLTLGTFAAVSLTLACDRNERAIIGRFFSTLQR